jgi:hypothetical protein
LPNLIQAKKRAKFCKDILHIFTGFSSEIPNKLRNYIRQDCTLSVFTLNQINFGLGFSPRQAGSEMGQKNFLYIYRIKTRKTCMKSITFFDYLRGKRPGHKFSVAGFYRLIVFISSYHRHHFFSFIAKAQKTQKRKIASPPPLKILKQTMRKKTLIIFDISSLFLFIFSSLFGNLSRKM